MRKNKGFIELLLPIIIAGALLIAGGVYLGTKLSGSSEGQNLGSVAFNPVQASPTTLSGSGIGTTDTVINVINLQTRQGTPITTAMLGGIGYGTIDPGTIREENISFTGITQNTNGTAQLTGVSRGLLPYYPYTPTSTLAQAHSGGATLILSNSAAFYSQFNIAANTSTITGNWTFASNSIPSYTAAPTFSNSLQIPDLAYVNGVASSGAPDANQSQKGIVQIATDAQIASGTATSTDGSQALWNVVSAGQYGKTYGATPTVVTNVYGSATGTASTTFSYSYTGATSTWVLPTLGAIVNGHSVSSSVSAVITAYGAQGGASGDGVQAGATGGQMIGTVPSSSLALGSTFYITVGGAGNLNGTGGYNGGGGDGGGSLGAGGGGGGMTTFSSQSSFSQVASTLIVAGGGGGSGVYENSGSHYGAGGNGGGATGATGATNGTTGGGGGTQSAGGTAGNNASAGTAGLGGAGGYCGGTWGAPGGGAGYFGGGGGGAVISGACAGIGGGGGGSSFASAGITTTSTSSGVNTGSGSITIVYTFNYNDPTEFVSSTVSGNNYAGTVTVSATTTHLSPTTSTINFAVWPFTVTNVSCGGIIWNATNTPTSINIIAESSSSVEFGFGSTIGNGEYNYDCTPY